MRISKRKVAVVANVIAIIKTSDGLLTLVNAVRIDLPKQYIPSGK